jgi:hypothetical protein
MPEVEEIPLPSARKTKHDNVFGSFDREISVKLTSMALMYKTHKKVKKKGNAITVTRLGGLYRCETLRISQFLDNLLTDSGEIVILTRRPHFIPQEYSWN